ncbi:hypothetical protein WA158_002746 [Blastocystis sp. Blastoise]
MAKRRRDADAFASSSESDNDIDNSPSNSEESDGEDLMESPERDYRAIPELDQYDADGMAQSQSPGTIDYEARLAAERDMDKRDVAEGRRLPAALVSTDDEDLDSLSESRAKRQRYTVAAEGFDTNDAPLQLNTIGIQGSLAEILSQENVKQAIIKRFSDFLLSFVLPSNEQLTESQPSQLEEKDAYYMNKIHDMCKNNLQSLEVSYMHISSVDPQLAIWLADEPKIIIRYLNEATLDVVLNEFTSYNRIHDTIYVRIINLPIEDQLRDLRTIHLNSLINVKGVITRRTGVFPQLTLVKFICTRCNNSIGPFPQTTDKEIKLGTCPACQSKGPFKLDTQQTVYRNYQKIYLQESPGSVPAGRIPRSKEVILTGDLIDIARPGEEVYVIGTYTNNFDMSLNTKNGFPVFSTVIEANSIKKENDILGDLVLSTEDVAAIQELSKDRQLEDRILASIAPFIFRHRNVKMAIALALFGGCEKVTQKHRIRGDINVLLLGDPGTAKSQFLKYAEKTSPRAVYTTGKGASAVGLTASVHRDQITREWTLEGGALVLADRGVCLIDEFDKMNDNDRVSIHEAMEQQSISISKAGIVASLQARCSVIAAANPKFGRYDATKTFSENVELTDPILSRFDVLCVLQDIVDPIEDERLAYFVIENHQRSHPSSNPETDQSERTVDSEGIPLISQDLLRKYIVYARSRVNPALEGIDQNKISKVYAELRQESIQAGGIPIAVRHIESIIRMAEAHARMFLRDHVNDEDIDVALATLLDSFINAQKHSVKSALRKSFQKYIIAADDNNDLIMHCLQQLISEYIQIYHITHDDTLPDIVEIPIKELEERARTMEITSVNSFLNSDLFRLRGFQLSSDNQKIIRHFENVNTN